MPAKRKGHPSQGSPCPTAGPAASRWQGTELVSDADADAGGDRAEHG
jgi:hypothetical protein